MTADTALAMLQDAIITVIKVSAPPLIVALIVGLTVSIFQATTQINEQTLAFVPKIIGVFLALVIFGPWMVTQLTDLFQRLYQYTQLVSQFVHWA